MAKTKTEVVIEEAPEAGMDFLVVRGCEGEHVMQQCAAEDVQGVIVGAYLTIGEALTQIAELEAANG